MKNNGKEARRSRSQAYQHLLLEICNSNEMMEGYSNEDSVYGKLNPFDYNDELLELEDELKREFWRIVENLTERQREVIRLYAEGWTQMEIAKKLNVVQSSITKNLRGNRCYYEEGKDSGKVKSYGGSFRKLTKMIEDDEKIRAILQRMSEIRTEKW